MGRVVPYPQETGRGTAQPAASNSYVAERGSETFGFTLDAGPDSETTPGFKGYVPIAWAGEITGWWITTDNPDGYIQVEVVRAGPGSDQGDSPIGSTTLSGAHYPSVNNDSFGYGNTSLWPDKAVQANQQIRFDVKTVSGVSRATLVLLVSTNIN